MKSYKNSEHIITQNTQYRNELQKGLDKKESAVTNTPWMFWFDNIMDGSTTIIPSKNKIHSVIHKNLERKYLTSRDYYNSKVITDIVYNENTNLVSVFKDYLIYDDVSEFLKRYYSNLSILSLMKRRKSWNQLYFWESYLVNLS